MSCFDCDLCKHAEYCEYSYVYSDCYIGTIKTAKKVVDVDFKNFYSKLEKKAQDLYDHHIDYLVSCMKSIVHDSEQVLPNWVSNKKDMDEV